MSIRRAAWAALLCLAIGLLSACGGASDNGVASKSPDGIFSAATNAVDGAKTVHVAGSGVDSGTPVGVDLELVAGKGASGNISEGGLSFQLIEVGQLLYLKGSPSFWRHYGGAAAAQLLQGKWLEAPANNGDFASLSSLTNIRSLFSSLSNHGTLVKGKTSTVSGRKVVAITDAQKGGTMYVATTGKPYPIEIVKAGSGGGHFTFDRYDQPVALSAPSSAINLQQLQSLASK
jgi:hypothetical protein